jgi:DNA-binding MarR family transcriptional regulator
MSVKSKKKPGEKSDKEGIRLELEQRSFYRFSLLATQLNRAVAGAYVQQIGRPANGWRIITVLGNFGPLSASQIHTHTTLEMDKITRIVDSLVEMGVATREQDKADRRRVIITLSAKGKRIYGKIENIVGEMEQEFLAELSRGEREVLYELLDRLQIRANKVFKIKRNWGELD